MIPDTTYSILYTPRWDRERRVEILEFDIHFNKKILRHEVSKYPLTVLLEV